jgi:hypothetical protein
MSRSGQSAVPNIPGRSTSMTPASHEACHGLRQTGFEGRSSEESLSRASAKHALAAQVAGHQCSVIPTLHRHARGKGTSLDSSAYVSRCSLYVRSRRGTRIGRPKLTVEQILRARLRCASGERQFSRLARDFGVSQEAVRNAAGGGPRSTCPCHRGGAGESPLVIGAVPMTQTATRSRLSRSGRALPKGTGP